MRFKVVLTSAGVHAVIVGKNGAPIWTTEVYEDRRTAEHAIHLITSAIENKSFETIIEYVTE